MERKKIVVDASIVVKWFLIEEYSDKAIELRNDYIKGLFIIAVPSLLKYEVLNALKYSGVYSIEELIEIGLALNKYGFEIYELDHELKRYSIELSILNNITIYDASYIALAKYLGTMLYTADHELISKFPDIAIPIKKYSRSYDS